MGETKRECLRLNHRMRNCQVRAGQLVSKSKGENVNTRAEADGMDLGGVRCGGRACKKTLDAL